VIVTEQYPRGLGATVPEIKDELADYHYVERYTFQPVMMNYLRFLQLLSAGHL
jgi:hypothetical protein